MFPGRGTELLIHESVSESSRSMTDLVFVRNETENYKFAFIQLAVTSIYFAMLTTIDFVQYFWHKPQFKM